MIKTVINTKDLLCLSANCTENNQTRGLTFLTVRKDVQNGGRSISKIDYGI